MKSTLRARVVLLLPAILFLSSVTIAQTPAFSVDQQNALDSLKTLARDLKSEPDKLAAGRLQARIADELWTLDEPFAREVFRSAFDTVSQPVADDLPKEKQASYVNRQALALKEVLRRFGAHDDKQAAAWLRSFERENVAKNPTAKTDSARPDLFMQIAAQIAMTDPDQALKLGLAALSGDRIPDGFGVLLFSLSRNNRSRGDELFRAAVATLRRSNFVFDRALHSLFNYIFTADNERHSGASPADAQLLANLYVDAAWKQPGGDGNPVPPASLAFYTTLELRALPIVAQYAPSRLPELRGQMTRIASGLNAEQLQRTELLRTTHQQENAIWTRNNYTIDEQIERAEKQKNAEVRDVLFMTIANAIMREDPDRALTIAKKIDDPQLRTTTEDDIYFVKIVRLLSAHPSIDEARKVSLQLSNPVFRAKVLIQLSAKVWTSNKDQSLATELLSEALAAAAKGDDIPDKVLAQLQVAQQFVKFDSIRAFEVLATALATMNRIKADTPTPSLLAKPRLLTIKNFTVMNGVEMTTTNDATLDSIDFREVRTLTTSDYTQARLLASKLEQPMQRANYLIAVAASVLRPEKPKRVLVN